MKSVVSGIATAAILVCFAGPAVGQVFVGFEVCNVNGAITPKGTFGYIRQDPTGAHVFNARLGDNGGGNGGESVDAVAFLDLPDGSGGFVTELTCIATADEDTGGDLALGLSDGTISDPTFGDIPEVDPAGSAD